LPASTSQAGTGSPVMTTPNASAAPWHLQPHDSSGITPGCERRQRRRDRRA
jgi:hypothetical protein